MNLAPNGKQSNLNEEQWHLVRTPEFKRWFGDWEKLAYAKLKDAAMDDVTLERLSKNVSKVVDENGEPLVCYHYSPKDFVIFDKKQHPKIANFVENKYHKHLGYDFSTKKGFFQTKDSFEYKVFLNVRNIFNIKYATEKQFEPLIKILSSIPYYSHYEYRKSDLERDIQELKKGQWDSLELPSIEKYLSKKYDGLIMYERDWLNIKVYDNKNIKLADGTNTTFDGNNTDIRFKNGGEIPTHKFILYDDLNEALEDSLYKQATDYFEKKVTDDYWHFSKQYYNGNEITYEVYSVKGGFWLNFEVKNKQIISSSAKLLPIKKYSNGGNVNFTYEIGGL